MTQALTRRGILRASAGIAASLSPVGVRADAPTDQEQFAGDQKTISEWMDQWMTGPAPDGSKVPVGELHVSRFADPIYFLLKPITWKPNPGQEAYQAVTVPVG